MSAEEDSRVYTINLSKVTLSPKIRRTKRAINMIKEFATRHMKAEEVKIDAELNREIWRRGIRHPPRRVRVKMTK
ncbi:MAG: 50S ribosomal protein L31e, partial [Nitrososphaerales archaeon]